MAAALRARAPRPRSFAGLSFDALGSRRQRVFGFSQRLNRIGDEGAGVDMETQPLREDTKLAGAFGQTRLLKLFAAHALLARLVLRT
jgi:hypothetical protein